jgi:hypothetical protein
MNASSMMESTISTPMAALSAIDVDIAAYMAWMSRESESGFSR